MTREIKFRAWDTRFNDMHYYADVRTWHLNTPDLEECTLMQFTGLKDRNGKEIYEGDIVKIKYYNLSLGDVYKNVEVKWTSVSGSDEMGTDMVGFMDVSGSEVVGNIFESPELLTNK